MISTADDLHRDGKMHHKRYKYVCLKEMEPGHPLISTHTVAVKQAASRGLGRWMLGLPLVLITALSYGTIRAAGSVVILLALALAGAHLRRRRSVQQEAVVVMPTLGVQLETVYGCGKVSHRFYPMHSVLAAVINEAVTPTHCYSYLALLLRDESKLALAFQTQPPVDMLVPVWRCLCTAIAAANSSPNAST